jgi:hypothetical protein
VTTLWTAWLVSQEFDPWQGKKSKFFYFPTTWLKDQQTPTDLSLQDKAAEVCN